MNEMNEMKNFKALFLNKTVAGIDAARITNIRNFGGFGNKPIGCLWFARYTPEARFLSDWQRWCYYEQFNLEGVFGEGIIFTFKEDARICVVNTYADYEALCAAYPIDESRRYTPNKIDWVKLSKDFDVFFLTEEARYEAYDEFYGWDVESGVVFNASAIASQEHITVNTAAIVGEEAAAYMTEPNATRTYVYSVSIPGKGRMSGFAKACYSYEIMEQLWSKYVSPTNSYSENQKIRDRIRDSLEVYFVGEKSCSLCDHTQDLCYM